MRVKNRSRAGLGRLPVHLSKQVVRKVPIADMLYALVQRLDGEGTPSEACLWCKRGRPRGIGAKTRKPRSKSEARLDAIEINAERHDKRIFSVGKQIAIASNAS